MSVAGVWLGLFSNCCEASGGSVIKGAEHGALIVAGFELRSFCIVATRLGFTTTEEVFGSDLGGR